VVLTIPKVAVPVKFLDYRPISLLAGLSKVFEVLMARQMESNIPRNKLLTAAVVSIKGHGGAFGFLSGI
jgi:hypothetical protein